MKYYDAIVIVAGHNGLTCACYLAKAGLAVLVVEGSAHIGGTTSTRELVVPGFFTDIQASGYQLANLSSAQDELNLVDFGLELLRPDTSFSKAFSDHSSLSIISNIKDTRESIAQYSQRDADTWETLFNNYLSHKDADTRNRGPASFTW